VKPTRRKVLIGGTLATGLLALGAGVYLPGPAAGRNVLSKGELAVVGALAAVMFPPGNALGVDASRAEVMKGVDALLGDTLDPGMARSFRYLLRGIEWGTVPLVGRRFSRCSLGKRQALMERWDRPGSWVGRVTGASVRAVLGMAYFNHPDVLDAVGWRVGCRLGAS